MKNTTYTDLKDRVMALKCVSLLDSLGGYKENWTEQGLMWAVIHLLKPCPLPQKNTEKTPLKSYDVIIRSHGQCENINGFYWKKWLLKVVAPGDFSSCKRFLKLRTHSLKREDLL